MVKPISKGRQKIEMKKIQNKISLGVTFTKRRNGLFKKANELVTLCGVELALIIFSPGNKVYSFGHPSVNAIIDRFIYQINDESQDYFGFNNFMEEYHKMKVQNLYNQLKEIQDQTEIEKKNAKDNKKASQEGNIIEMPSRDRLNLPQFVQLQTMVIELKERVLSEIQQRFVLGSINSANMNNYSTQSGGPFYNNNFGAPEIGINNVPGPNYGLWNF